MKIYSGREMNYGPIDFKHDSFGSLLRLVLICKVVEFLLPQFRKTRIFRYVNTSIFNFILYWKRLTVHVFNYAIQN